MTEGETRPQEEPEPNDEVLPDRELMESEPATDPDRPFGRVPKEAGSEPVLLRATSRFLGCRSSGDDALQRLVYVLKPRKLE